MLSDAAVRVEGETVAEIGDWADLRARFPEAAVLGSERHALLPGLINAHHHSYGATLQQQGIADDLLELWLLSESLGRPLDRRLAALLNSARLLRSGVTSVVDVHSGGGTPEAYAGNARAALAGYREAGIRATLALSLMTEGFLVPGAGQDARFLAGLPEDLRRFAESRLPGPERLGEDDWFAAVDALRRETRDEPRLQLWYAPPGPQWVSDGFLQRIAEAAERHDAGVQTHVTESLYEMLHGHREWGKGTVEHLHDLGVLGPRFSIAHGVWLSEREIDLLAETGTALVHNPGSNLRLRAGIAPLAALLARGVTVALGMDATTLNDDEDFFAEMRLALRLQASPRLDGPVLSPARLLGLATAGGARLLRREGRLGVLAPGAAADLVVLDLERPTWPWVAPEIDPRDFLVMRAAAGDVDTVLVAGEVVLSAGRPTRFDLASVGAEAAAALDAERFPAEQAAQVERLRRHVADWYRAWEVPELRPYEIRNARG